MNDETPRYRVWRRLWHYLKRALQVVCGIVLLFVASVLIGLVPVNNGFRPSADGIEIHVLSGAVHADVILPLDAGGVDWRERFPTRCFAGKTETATHIAIGWGDRSFFVETPNWSDMRISTAAAAVFLPTESCLHVSMTRLDDPDPSMRSVKISIAQYQRMVERIESSFRKAPDGSMVQVPGVSYHRNDAFFEAYGHYHALHTCNSWVGDKMKAAGIRTPWFTPLPKTVLLYLPQ